jgi:hypothetical protein
MQCKNHSDRNAEHICAGCNAPLCSDCVEEVKPGVFTCFQCAMVESVSQVGSNLKDKREKAIEKELTEKKKWGAFQYFLIGSSVLILAMWGVILFGGRAAPPRTVDFEKEGRVLLFAVDGALKRFAHYEGNRFPELLADLVPKYLGLKKTELFHLKRLSYERDPKAGYRLSLANQKNGDLNLVLSPKGIDYLPLPKGDD